MVVSEGAINNIMGGMENTAGVRLHSHRHKLKQRFDIMRKLGQGTYGKVQLAINKETGQEVAIKTIKKAKIETEQDLVRIRREIQIMSSVQHPQIIHIYEVFENREKMVLVMEYAAGGELYDYLSERKVLPEAEARRVFRHVASAVYYCHKHKICHRDLKLENILLDLDGNAKIADFGLSNVFDDKLRLDTFCGSPLYASPEIVKGVPYVGPEVDCWSLGVLLYTLVYGAMPFDGSNFRRLVKQITQGDFYEPPTPATASELIRHMLTVHSTERATIEDICSHWWVNEGYSESCLTQAETLANQTPVRLDLLLSLAPKQISSEHLMIQPEDDSEAAGKGPPNLHIPPPPQSEDVETEPSLPPRCHSMGSVAPGDTSGIDLILEKKRQERKSQEDKKRPNEDVQPVEKKKKKDSSSKKPPSTNRSNKEELIERKKPSITKDELEDKSLKKKESSVEKEEPKVTQKRESSVTRKLSAKKTSATPKERSVDSEVKVLSNDKLAVDSSIKSNPIRDTPSPSPSTSSTLKASDSSISRKSVSPVKVVPNDRPLSVKPKEKNSPKPLIVNEEPLNESTKTAATDKVLKETAAKMEEVEQEQSLQTQLNKSSTFTSPILSSHNSSQGSTPARSRTGSESSTEARSSSKGDVSRRQSKIFSKAAMFDNISTDSKSPPVLDKPKKIGRPGALNMSDLAKRFADKPNVDKKNKVVSPFKVSDARKAFESKADKSFSESPIRKASGGSSGSESQSMSPSGSASMSPTKTNKPFVNSSTELAPSVGKIEQNSTSKVSPVKDVIKKSSVHKSPPKETSIRKEKSPVPTVVKKEKSPVPVVVRKEKSPSPVKTKESPVKVGIVPSDSKLLKKDEPKVISKPDLKTKKEEQIAKGKLPASIAARLIEIKAETSDSSDSECEAEKMLRVLAEKREKLEWAKKEKLRKVSEVKEKEMPPITEEQKAASLDKSDNDNKDQKFATLPRGFKSKTSAKPKPVWDINDQESVSPGDSSIPKSVPPSGKRIPIAKEVVPVSPEQVLSPTPREASDLKNINTYVEPRSPVETPKLKSQMEIVLDQQPTKNQPLKPQKSFEIKVTRDNSKPEFKTEVLHTVSSPKLKPTGEAQLQRARRERIIPIMLEDDSNSIGSVPIQVSSSSSSKASSSSSSRITNFGMAPVSSTLGSSAQKIKTQATASPESIKKSRRERIIPISVEGEGLISPPISESASSEGIRTSFHRTGGSSNHEREPRKRRSHPVRSEGSFSSQVSNKSERKPEQNHSRGRSFLLDRADSFSSAGEDDDEDEDDGFQILTAESLFSTLLSRVRSLTRKMTDEGGRARRTPQPNLPTTNQDPSGFWSSLYSPPRDSPARRVSEGLSRAQSKEDDSLGGFTSPMWTRNSMSRDGSDAESVFSDTSGPFSTLPRGWRSRRSTTREETEMPQGSFASIRLPLYSRTHSRDYPEISTSNASIQEEQTPPKMFSSAKSPLQREQKSSSSVGGNMADRTDQPSGEAKGRVGGHYESREFTPQLVTRMTASSPRREKESYKQLKDLVQELEDQDDTLDAGGNKPFVSLHSENSVPTPSKSLGSFSTNQSVLNNYSNTNTSVDNANAKVSIRPPINSITGLKKPISKSMSIGSTSAIFKSDNGKTIPISHSVVIVNSNHLNTNNLPPKTQNLVGISESKGNGNEKNVGNIAFIPKSDLSSASVANPMNSKETISNNQHNNTKLSNGSGSSTNYAPLHTNTSSSDLNYKSRNQIPSYLTVEPYRRGKSEDLRSTIDLVNKLDASSSNSSLKPYRRSKSKDITPTIEAASEKFTKANLNTPRKISPYEAYRRSKSKEMSAAINELNANSTSVSSSSQCFFDSTRAPIQPSTIPVRIQMTPVVTQAETPTLKIVSSNPILEEEPFCNIAPVVTVHSPDSFSVQNKNLESINQREVEPDSQSDVMKKEKVKDTSEKSKSMYKMLTSKFTRSLSNLGEDQKNSQKRDLVEEDLSEKGEKFKLKRPSIFLKSKEKSVTRTNADETDVLKEEEDFEGGNKGDKKSSKTLSYALNKFLGRKPEDVSKNECLASPIKSPSAAVISDKNKKPPRFRSKNYSKSHENLNKKLVPEENCVTTNGTIPISNSNQSNFNADTGNDTSFHNGENNQISATGDSKQNTVMMNLKFISPRDQSMSPVFEKENRNLASNEINKEDTTASECDSDFLNPSLEDIKEADDESVMDRITRKSYYSRFNEVKRKPKIRRVDSKESIDQQLAAAKARLQKEDDDNWRAVRQSLSPSRMASPPLMSSSPPPAIWENVPRRSLKKQIGPRTTSLPPEEGFYACHSKSNMYQDPQLRRMQSPMREETRMSVERDQQPNFYRSTSFAKDEPLRSSVAREEPKRASVAREDFRRASVVREDPSRMSVSRSITSMPREVSSYGSQNSAIRNNSVSRMLPVSVENPQLYARLSNRSRVSQDAVSSGNSQTSYDNTKDRISSPSFPEKSSRLSSVSRDDMRLKSQFSSTRENTPNYQTLPYRKSSTIHLDNLSSGTKSSYGTDSEYLSQRKSIQRQISASNELSKSSSIETSNEASMTTNSAPGTITSNAYADENIPVNSSSGSAAVVSAREELSRRLTPLTRLSNMGGESYVRPYRRTMTSGTLPLGQTNKPNVPRDIPTYKRTHTLDLPVSENRTQSQDYTRRGFQDPSRRYSGVRSSMSESTSPLMTSSLSGRSSISPLIYSGSYGIPTTSYTPTSYRSYVSPTPSYSSPPSTISLTRRSSLYRY